MVDMTNWFMSVPWHVWVFRNHIAGLQYVSTWNHLGFCLEPYVESTTSATTGQCCYDASSRDINKNVFVLPMSVTSTMQRSHSASPGETGNFVTLWGRIVDPSAAHILALILRAHTLSYHHL
jgi:hypothetical protein